MDYETLFDGTLGAWKTTPVSFELKEGARPYHGWGFPIPKALKATIMKEIKCLCKLGVSEWQPTSEWAVPSFIHPKKNKTVRFLTSFRELNKRLVRKPFPLPKISTVLQELEGFTFATALILTWAITPLDWILMHPESAPSFSLGASLLQKVTDGHCRLT